MKYLLALTTAAVIGLGGITYAQAPHQGHGAKTTTKDSPATKAYRAANAKMHKGMDIRFANDADIDMRKIICAIAYAASAADAAVVLPTPQARKNRAPKMDALSSE